MDISEISIIFRMEMMTCIDNNVVGRLLTVGTYNCLLPYYGKKWNNAESCYKNGGDNWDVRSRSLAEILSKSSLDVYLLQEVGNKEVKDIYYLISDRYDFQNVLHPGRRDGLAIFYLKDRFEFLQKNVVNHSHINGHSSLFVRLRDKATQKETFFASIHLDWARYSGDEQLDHIDHVLSKIELPSVAIIGGDFNRDKDFLSSIPFFSKWLHGLDDRPTCGSKKIDWIFFKSRDMEEVLLSHVAPHDPYSLSKEPQEFSGCPSSDHFLHAAAFRWGSVNKTNDVVDLREKKDNR